MQLVSVITPLFNAEDFIGETIESVQAQTYKNWEMLIVDDCSTDRSREVVYRYMQQDERIRLVVLENHFGGPARPRNVGMRNAKGDYIAFIDADDVWFKEKIENEVAFLDANKDVYLVYSRFFINKNGKISNKVMPGNGSLKSGKIFNHLFLSHNFIACLTVMMRNGQDGDRYFFDEDPKLVAIEDFDLWLRISRNRKISFIKKPLAVYRIHAGNISHKIRYFIERYLALIRKWRPYVSKALLMRKYVLFSSFIIFQLFKNFFCLLYVLMEPARAKVRGS